MVLLAVTADTWIVTGLGFGIVLALLFCLVFIMMLFGWIMQKAAEPKAPKVSKEEKPITNSPKPMANTTPSEPEKAAIAMALSAAEGNDEAAVAYALYLAHHSKHDIPTGMIPVQARETAWSTKSYGLNNIGF